MAFTSIIGSHYLHYISKRVYFRCIFGVFTFIPVPVCLSLPTNCPLTQKLEKVDGLAKLVFGNGKHPYTRKYPTRKETFV